MKGLFMMEEIVNKVNYWLLATIMGHYTVNFEKYEIPNLLNVAIGRFQNGTIKIIFNKEEFVKLGKFIFDKMIKDPEWFDGLNKQVFDINKDYMRFSKQMLKLDLPRLSTIDIVKNLKRYYKIKDEAHFVGQPAVVLDFDTPFFTEYLINHLKGKCENANEVFRILTTPTSRYFSHIEKIELLKIAKEIKTDEKSAKFFKENSVLDIGKKLFAINNKIDMLIDEHFKSFRWLCFMFEGPAYEKEYFIGRLKEFIKLDCEKEIRKIDENFSEIKKQQQELIRKIGIDKKHERLFEIARDIIFLKSFRKDCMFFGCYATEGLSDELAKRLDVELKYLRSLLLDEIEEIVVKEKRFPLELAKKRYEKSAYIAYKDRFEIVYDEKADEIIRNLEEDNEGEIKGHCACSGKAKGKVKVINLREDMAKMENGDVLVSIATNPDLVPAMEKAAAFVTDMGGITCHAAIVAREMQKPCVIGTKNATRLLQDGDIVEVDAENGIVRKLL